MLLHHLAAEKCWLSRRRHSVPVVPYLCSYDVYVLGVQEAVSDNVFDAFAKYPGACHPPNAIWVPCGVTRPPPPPSCFPAANHQTMSPPHAPVCCKPRILCTHSPYPGCYRLPLFAKLDPAREAHRAAVRSRRLGHAMWVSDMIAADKAEPGKHFPPTTQFDMVRHVKHRHALALSMSALGVGGVVRGSIRVGL
jgi:hypothetical protein